MLVIQFAEVAAGGIQGDAVEGGSGVGIEAGAWDQAEPAEQPLLARGQVGVGQIERGRHGQVLGVHQGQLVPGGGQFGGHPGGGPGGVMPSCLASIPIACGRYPHSRVISPAGPRAARSGLAGQPGQQLDGLPRGQGLQADDLGVLQPGQPAPAGDQHQAARRPGQQRPDLLMPGRVIQHQQDLLARH